METDLWYEPSTHGPPRIQKGTCNIYHQHGNDCGILVVPRIDSLLLLHSFGGSLGGKWPAVIEFYRFLSITDVQCLHHCGILQVSSAYHARAILIFRKTSFYWVQTSYWMLLDLLWFILGCLLHTKHAQNQIWLKHSKTIQCHFDSWKWIIMIIYDDLLLLKVYKEDTTQLQSFEFRHHDVRYNLPEALSSL